MVCAHDDILALTVGFRRNPWTLFPSKKKKSRRGTSNIESRGVAAGHTNKHERQPKLFPRACLRIFTLYQTSMPWWRERHAARKYLMQRHLIAPEKKTGTVFPALFLSDALDAFPGAEWVVVVQIYSPRLAVVMSA